MNEWEGRLEEKLQEILNELSYTDMEYIDNSYDIFHEALELDTGDYRSKISERRKESLIDLMIDTLGSSDDANSVVEFIMKKLDITLK